MATAKVRKARDGLSELSMSDVEWSSEHAELYRERGCRAVVISALRKGFELPDVAFLAELDGLERVRLLGAVKDDTAAFEVPSLSSLEVATSCRAPVRFSAPGLEKLDVRWRPGVEGISELSALRELTVVDWAAPDFRPLGEKPALEFLRVELPRKAAVASAGLRGAPALRTLWLYDGTLTDTAELAALEQLTELALRATKVPDLEFLSGCRRLRTLELDGCGDIASLASLRDHPTLRSIAIAGNTKIVDGDLSPLLSPKLTEVAVDKGHPHYSHRPAQVRRP
jgi:hypothetical protein